MAERTAKSGKKVVKVEQAEPSQKAKDLANEAVRNNTDGVWKPTPEAKSKATTFRIVAVIFWVLAIAAEAVTIFWLLKQSEASWFLWALIGAIGGRICQALIGGSKLGVGQARPAILGDVHRRQRLAAAPREIGLVGSWGHARLLANKRERKLLSVASLLGNGGAIPTI